MNKELFYKLLNKPYEKEAKLAEKFIICRNRPMKNGQK